MSEPTSAASFYDLILGVAKEAGMSYHGSSGNERAMIPIDAHDLDLCKNVVNKGIRMFIANAPIRGWRWMRRKMVVTLTATRTTGTVDSIPVANQLTDATLEDTYDTDDDIKNWYVYILTGTGAGSYAKITGYTASGGTFTVSDWLDAYGNVGGTDPVATDTFCITPVETVGGDIARYPLAENFGGEVNGQIEYAAGTGHGSPIDWCDESRIRALRAVSVQTGHSSLAAIRPLEPYGTIGPKRRFELILDPQPTAADVLEFPYTLYFDKLRLEAGSASSVSGSTGLLDSTLDNLYPDDYFNGWVIKIISGTGKNSYALVDDYTGGTAQFDVVDWLSIDGSAAGTDPAASSVYVIEPAANLHPAGFRFDQAILSACLAQGEMSIEEMTAGWVNMYKKVDLPEAHQIDARSAPRKLGNMNGGVYRERYWTNVTTDHDI